MFAYRLFKGTKQAFHVRQQLFSIVLSDLLLIFSRWEKWS